jgi:phosphate butyryltransferase
MYVKNFQHLLKLAKEKPTKKIAVVAADDAEVLEVIEKAESMDLAEFVLIGDLAKINAITAQNGWNLKAEIIDEKDHKEAAEKAVELVTSGQAGTLMKGMLHSSVFLKALLNKEKGLNIGKRITQISVLEKENDGGFLFVTDCAITVNPDLRGKKEVLENAVDLAHKLGNEMPKVAVLAALEVINPDMQETIDAAVLSKMAERKQIKGCVVDGPLALDNAVSLEAAQAKDVSGPVAGNADILVVPNITVGNALTKTLTYLAKRTVIAATMGAAIPIVFNSRTESIDGKLFSIALAAYIS